MTHTIPQAAAILDLSKARVWQLIQLGKLPATQGRYRIWLITDADLRHFQTLDRGPLANTGAPKP